MSEVWHQHKMRVQYKDTDRMGVVHHGNYITWFEVGRTEWMRHYGMNYYKMEEQGLLLPVLHAEVDYKKSAHFDDCVVIYSKVATYSPVRLEFHYEARKITEEEYKQMDTMTTAEPFGELLAKGSTKHMWVNPEWKPVRLNKVAPESYDALQNMMEK